MKGLVDRSLFFQGVALVGTVPPPCVFACDSFQDTLVVAAGLVTVEAGRVDGSVAGASLDRRVEERTPRLGWNPFEPRAENRLARKPSKTDFLGDIRHLAQQINGHAVGFAQLDARCI